MNLTRLARVLFVVAVATEAKPLTRRLGISVPSAAVGTVSTKIASCRLAISLVGVGRRRPAELAALLDKQQPVAAINFGFAGSLDPRLAPGSVVIVERWYGPEPPHAWLAGGDTDLATRLGQCLTASTVRWRPTAAVTVETPLQNPAHRDRLRAESNARIVEMEGAPWAIACARAGIPFTAIRVISDLADRRLPDLRHRLLTPAGRVRWLRWTRAMLAGDSWRQPSRQLRELGVARNDWLAAQTSLDATAAALLQRPERWLP